MNAKLLGMMRSGLFNGLDDDYISELFEQVEELEVSEGEWVLREGELADSFYIVLSGSLEAITHRDDGQDIHLDLLKPGDYFGEQALLPGSSGVRMASVCGVSPSSKLLRLSAKHLEEMLKLDPTLEARFHHVGQHYRERKMTLRTRLVQELLADVEGEPEKLHLNNGDTLYRQGDVNRGFFVILRGSVELLQEGKGLPIRLARMGPGLCLGVQDGETYQSTAIAYEETSLLLFPHETLSEVSARSPEVREYLAVFQKVWDLPQQGFVTQFLDKVEEKPCLTQRYFLPNERSLVAHHYIGEDSVSLSQPSCQGLRSLEAPDGTLSVSLDDSGQLCSLYSQHRSETLGVLFGRAIEGKPITLEEEQALQQTGCLENNDRSVLCTCLQVRRSTVLAALQQGASDLSALQRQTGAGLSCGSCIPHLKELLGEESFQPVVIHRMESPTDHVRRVFLQADGEGSLPPVEPGQHVILRTTISGDVVARPYTLSGAAKGPWEITVKREEHGVFSNWLFQEAKPGVLLEASRPQGDFVWDGGPSPVVCFVAGIGVTPALAMARTLLSEGWPHWLVIDWSTRSPKDVTIVSDLQQAVASNLVLHTRYTSREPRLTEKTAQSWHQRFPSAVYFLCGSQSFMDDVMGWLKAAGVPSERIRTENFTPS